MSGVKCTKWGKTFITILTVFFPVFKSINSLNWKKKMFKKTRLYILSHFPAQVNVS